MKALDKDQALLISAYTGYVLVNAFSEIHEYIEKVMERPVYTLEMADKNFNAELREKLKDEFLKLVPPQES